MAVGTLIACPHCGNQFPRKKCEHFCSDDCRFWHKVRRGGPHDCWIWTGTTPVFGHGQFVFDGRRIYAHRRSWEMTNGPVPEGQCVLHKCDVPACVNPAHLFLGTREENLADMRAKNRGSNPPRLIGIKHHSAKLTESDVLEIRASSKPQLVLAGQYGVARRTICNVINRKIWKHI